MSFDVIDVDINKKACHYCLL